tara:strand:- start:2378 stop:3316 length:939 start_codon:yes stop_codon:yes gene_type:complete
MTDNIDTPQSANPNDSNQAFEGPWPTEDSNNASVEEAFFGSQETETPQEQAPQIEDTPESAPMQEQAQEYNAKNDEKRFEYWQSQASKNQNQFAEMQKQNQELQAQMQAMQTMQQPVAEPKEEFPAPPEKPNKPRTFSREEAYADPNSESARYVDEYESWRDDMSEYNSLKQEYTVAQMQERLDAQEHQRQEEIQRQQAYAQQQEQMRGVSTHLQGHYGFNDSDAQEFIQQMSDPNSLSLDNLVQLYRLQKGQGQPDPNAGPSPEFQQTQRAQQIPSPMGVQTGQGQGNDARSDSDKIMDNMISDFTSKNPW